jgi:hypothetical protein
VSTGARTAGAKLRAKYARVFKLDLELVECAETFPDTCEVRCPTRPDLPKWSTGEIARLVPQTVVSPNRRTK